MATKEPEVIAETRAKEGKSTEEYSNLLSNFERIKEALESDEKAMETLTTKFKTAVWLDVKVKDITPKDLLVKVLDMVQNDTKYYDQLVEMIEQTDGLKHILRNLTVTQESNLSRSKQDMVVSLMPSRGSEKNLSMQSDLGYASSSVLPEKESDVTEYAGQRSSDDSSIYIGVKATRPHTQPLEAHAMVPKFHVGEYVPELKQSDKSPSTEYTAVQEETTDEGSPEEDYTLDFEHAKHYLSPNFIAHINKLKEEKIALTHEVEQLKISLTKAKEEKEVVSKEYEKKVNELEKCKKQLATTEKEKRELEKKQKEKIKKLEEDVEKLRSENSENKILISELGQKIAEAKQKLYEKDNEILKQKLKIQGFEHREELDRTALEHDQKVAEYEKSLREKDAEILRLSELHLSQGNERVTHL